MAHRIYFTGHRSFANHGCEALVRSAVALFGEALDVDEFLVPSADPAADARFWPDAPEHGVRFVPVVDPWPVHRWWERAVRRVPGWKHLPWPSMPVPQGARAALDRATLLVSTGGDNYSLDYGLVSLFTMIGLDGAAMDRGIPAVLWGASAGPFDSAPHVLPAVCRHLARFRRIVARETVSAGYLAGLGLERVSLAADPAFTLAPEPLDLLPFWPREGGKGVVAVNLSPIVRRQHAAAGGASLEDEAAEFVRDTVRRGYGVLLLPHVVGQVGDAAKCDHALLAALRDRTGDAGGRIALAPATLNAPQLKFALARCRFALGARTHCTIGALSSAVPTASIAYSVKARGINRDLFGDERHVIDGATLSRAALGRALDRLEAEEEEIRTRLRAAKDGWRRSLDAALAELRRDLAGASEGARAPGAAGSLRSAGT